MLALKLLLVPSLLAAISLAAQRWGPRVAGSLAGLPFVTGPILLLLALERGAAFTTSAAGGALSAVLASAGFSLAYCWCALRWPWWFCWIAAFACWSACIALFAALALPWPAAAATSALALLVCLRLFPRAGALPESISLPARELVYRMLAGAALTLAVTASAEHVGANLSGMLSVFPVFSTVLAVFSHRAYGSTFVIALLSSMSRGLFALVAFSSVLAFALPRWPIAAAFTVAVLAAWLVHAASRSVTAERWLRSAR